MLARPFLQNIVGGAEGAGPVHGGAPAKAGAGQNTDAAILGAEGALGVIELAHHVHFALRKVAAVTVGAFFQHQHVVPGLGQLTGHHAAARPGADDQHVAVIHHVLGGLQGFQGPFRMDQIL